MNSFIFGLNDAVVRLRARVAVGVALATLVAIVFVAWLGRRFTPGDAADYTLGGAVFGVGLPLLAYGAVGRVCGGQRLDDAVRSLSRHGADRRSAVFGVIVATALRVALVGAVLAFFAVLVSRGHADGASFLDALTSAWIGALGGAVYVAWFALASLFGKGGRGRSVALAVDWILGSATSAVAVPWPRAHLRSLLGGELVLGLPEWQSTVALYSLAFTYLAIVALRVAR